MNKTTILAVCILFLFGGLLGLHLAAQPGGTESRGTESRATGNAPDDAPAFSLLDPNVAERSERELLERKVVVHRNIVAQIDGLVQAGSRHGTANRLAGARADLAAAEIELYHHTDEQEKLLAAHQARVEHLKEKLRVTVQGFEIAAVSLDAVFEAELKLLDALLEQKRDRASLNLP